MDEQVEGFHKTFFIYQYQQEFLDKINSNSSLALRTILDSAINNEKHKQIKELLDKTLLFVSFGFIFWLISYLMINILQVVISLSIGCIFIIYSVYGGVTGALQLRKRK